MFVHQVMVPRTLSGECLSLEISLGKSKVQTDWNICQKPLYDEHLIGWTSHSIKASGISHQGEQDGKTARCILLPCYMIDIEVSSSLWKLQNAIGFKNCATILQNGLLSTKTSEKNTFQHILKNSIFALHQAKKYLINECYPELPNRTTLSQKDKKILKYEKIKLQNIVRCI